MVAMAAGLVIAGASSAFAQQTALQVKALVVDKEKGKSVHTGLVYVEAINKGVIWFRLRSLDSDIKQMNLNTVKSVFLSRPKDYVEAVENFENRKYEAALTGFDEIVKKYKNFNGIDDNFVALSGLYRLDCLRKLKQYDKLAAESPVFSDEKWLTKQSDKDQIAIYKLWALLKGKGYQRIITDYETIWRKKKLPGHLRAQVEFLYGKAQEANGDVSEALIAFCKAMNADFAGSEILTLEAVEASFNLIENDKEVQEIRTLWDQNKKNLIKPKINTMPYLRLLEAGALVRVHNKLAFSGFDEEGKMIPLPEKYTKYLKYTKAGGEKFLN